MRPRISIAGMAVLVLVCGVGLAAMRTGSRHLAGVVVTGTLIVLLTAIVGACVAHDRPFWLGFAVFGWGYGAIAFGPWTDLTLRPALPTSIVSYETYGYVHDVMPPGMAAYSPANRALGSVVIATADSRMMDAPLPFDGAGPWQYVPEPLGPSLQVIRTPEYEAFERSLHAMGTLAVGILGGLVGRGFAAREGDAGRRRPAQAWNATDGAETHDPAGQERV